MSTSDQSVQVDDRRKVAVVTTTIRVPHFFEKMLENATRHGHGEQISLIVVADRKTPAAVGDFLDDLARRYPADVVYLDLPAQGELLRRFPALEKILRHDSIQRRNVGFLQAAIGGFEVVVSVDDDNFITDDDFIGYHLAVGRRVKLPVVSHASGWWNVCRRLVCDPPRRFYHRGYPKSRQDFIDDEYQVRWDNVRAVVNAGLWLEVPDVDATTHMEEPINVVGMKSVEGSRACALAAGTWCPFNSQNTAFSAELLPAMYLPVMGERVGSLRLGRMDDIWLSYFVRTIADKLGDSVICGPPLVRQDRNPHNHLADLADELPGYLLTERLVEYLRCFESEETTYRGAYSDLIHHLCESLESDGELAQEQRECFRHLKVGMDAWHAAVGEIEGVR